MSNIHKVLISNGINALHDILYEGSTQPYIFSNTGVNTPLKFRVGKVQENSYSGLTAGDDFSNSKEVYCRPMVTIFTDATTE